ncbi:MAG: hypothetical protein WCF93_00735 [Candidatus Moraniibacteriota bacterium]
MSWIFKNKKLPSETESFMSFTENINTSQGKKWKALLFAFFVVVFSQFFAGVAHAGFCYCIVRDTSALSLDETQIIKNKVAYPNVADSASCLKTCGNAASQNDKDRTAYYFTQSETDSKISGLMNYTQVTNGYCYCAKKVGNNNANNSDIVDAKNNTMYDFVGSGDDCSKKCYATPGNTGQCGYYYFFSKTQDSTNSAQVSNYICAQGYGTTDALNDGATSIASGGTQTQQSVKAADPATPESNECSASLWTAITNPMEAVKCLLYGVLQALGWLLSLAAIIFQWVVDPANISGVGGLLVKPEVKNVWVMVRDTLNMTFIMILLFAAFCTVFQVEQWNLKKVWLSILINALLVNFSFAIARIFIDISNVAMYYFLNHLFSGTGGGSGSAIMASFSEQAKLSVLLAPADFAKAEIPYFLFSIVFTFILAMTLLVLAVLFLIRLIVLTILLMFSPIGFVGFIFPGTKTFASQWWENLFKYAFFGPVMVFMMMVAITIMKASATSGFMGAAAKNVPAGMSANWLASASYFTIPIIILWIAMGISQKMGIAGADKVVGAAKKWGGKAAMFMSGAGKAQNFFKKQKDTFAASRKKRSDELDKKTLGSRFGDRMNDTQDKFGGEKGQKRHDKRKEAKNKDDIKNGAEEKDNMAMPILKTEANSAVGRVGTVLTDEEKKNDAIIAKVALNRGAKYEKEIEDDARNVMETGYVRRVNRPGIHLDFDRKKNAHARVKDDFSVNERLKQGPLTGRESADEVAAYTAKMADWSATRAQLKDAVDKAKKEVEIEEKKLIQTVKTEHIDKLRKVVQAGEDIKKIKPRI